MTEEIQAEVIEEEPVTQELPVFDMTIPGLGLIRIDNLITLIQIRDGINAMGLGTLEQAQEILGANLPPAE